MGFDNECIVNIQTLPGEYFCPVCRTLVYPSEALQAQCTHLYCKPCLAYVVATTRACPYDGYLVTEADAKPLIESNKSVADAINSIQVHCLFHRSGCQWLGSFLDCISHCTDCSFGNSPVVCNRCGTQIIHRQVQEHAQICPGVQPQAQQIDGAQAQTSADQNLAVGHAVPQTSQDPASQSTAGSAPAPLVAPAANSGAVSAPASLPTSTVAQPQAVAQTAPTPEQWYQQQQIQYQQYYQQYPGYDPYQQHYQQYGQFQQQPTSQYQQPQVQSYPQQASQVQQHPQPYAQPQSVHPHSHPQPQPQPQAQPLQLQSQPPGLPHQQTHGHVQQSQIPQQTLSAAVAIPQPQVQMPPQANLPPQGQVPAQQMGFPPTQPYQVADQPPQIQSQPRPQLQPPVVQQQQLAPAIPQLQQQPAQQHFYPQPLSGVLHPQTQQQIHSQTPQPPLHTTHPMTGHQSYPQHQLLQQPTALQQPAIPQQPAASQQVAPQQRPVAAYPQQQGPYQISQYPPQPQNQFSPHPPQLRLPHPGALPNQPSSEQTVHQRSGFQPSPVQQSLPSNQIHGQPPPPHRDSFAPLHLGTPQQALRPQGLPYVQQQLPAQQSPQGVTGKSVIGNYGMTQQAFGVPPGAPANLQQNNSKQSVDQTYHHAQQLQQALPGVVTQQSDSMASKVGQSAGAVVKTSPSKIGIKDTSENSRMHTEMSQAVEGNKGKNSEEAGDAEPERKSKIVSESISNRQKNELQEPSVTRSVKEEHAEDKSPNGVALASDDRNDTEGRPDNFSRESVRGQREQDENAVCMQTGEELENKKSLPDKSPPAFQDKNLAQFPSSTFSGEHRTLPSGEMLSKVAGPPGHPSQTHKQEGYPKQLLPYDSLQNMPHAGPPVSQFRPNPDRRFPEIATHQIPPTHGQSLAPPPMRPPLQGFFPENIRPDVFQPPVERPPGQFHAGPPPGVFPSAVAPSSLARTSAYQDPNLFPQGVVPPFRAGGNMGQVEPLRAPPPGGPLRPPLGVFEAPGIMWGSVPPTGVEGQAVRPGFPKPVEREMLPGGIPDYYNSRQHEPGIPAERSNLLKMNGDSGTVLEPVFQNLTEGRFRAFPEERYKHMPDDGFTHPADERFRQFPLDHSSRGFVDRREFEEDLKQFPRPSNLEGDGASKFKNHSLASRAFERGSRVLGLDTGPRPFDRFDGDGRYKFDSNAAAMTSIRAPLSGSPGAYAEQRMEASERHRFFGDNLGRDPNHPDYHGSASELVRQNKDSQFRSPAKNITGPPFNKFGDFSEREPHGFGERSRLSSLSSPSRITNHLFRNEGFDNPHVGDRLIAGAPDVQDFMQNRFRSGDFFSSRMGSLRFGGSHSHMQMDETVGFSKFPPHLRNMDPIVGNMHGHFNSGLLHNDIIDHSRRRKLGNVGWCRICKIDCDSVEGLDLHSQTREHQKMAMDIVLRIKQDNAKRQKSYDLSTSNDDMKSKKIKSDNESKEKKLTGESQ